MWISIWQSVFSQYGVHFSVVLAGLSKHIYNLSERILCFVRPFCNFHYCLIAILCSFKFIFRYKDIVGKCACFCDEESIIFRNLQSTHKSSFGSVKYFYHLSFYLLFLTFCTEGNLHLVIVHGVGRVSFSNKDRFSTIIRYKRVLAVTFSYESTGHYLTSVIQFPSSLFCFNQEVVFCHILHYVGT